MTLRKGDGFCGDVLNGVLFIETLDEPDTGRGVDLEGDVGEALLGSTFTC